MLNEQRVEKPEKRSKLRKIIGKKYFTLKRQIKWRFGNKKFAKVHGDFKLSHSIFQHKSLLLRQLKGVDMYLQHNKVTNLKIAISRIDKVVILPGQTFSIWKLVGRPTKSKGYLEGLILHNGKTLIGTGGGLCQLGNLLYWMALHSPITITERWRHGYDVFPDVNRTIPFACGATLSYNYIDLQLQNNTDQAFQINLWLDKNNLNGEICSNKELKLKYEIVETDHFFQQQWWGGYTRHNKIWKKITSIENNTFTEELVAENSAIMMYSPLIEQS